MNRQEKLLHKLSQLEFECKIHLEQIKKLDRIQGWSWFVFAFIMMPILFLVLLKFFFNVVVFDSITSYPWVWLLLVMLEFLFLQYSRVQSSQHYEKFLSKQKWANSICFVLQRPYPQIIS